MNNGEQHISEKIQRNNDIKLRETIIQNEQEQSQVEKTNQARKGRRRINGRAESRLRVADVSSKSKHQSRARKSPKARVSASPDLSISLLLLSRYLANRAEQIAMPGMDSCVYI